MSSTLDRIRQLVAEGSVRISDHGYDELAADGLLAGEVLAGVENARLVEDYPQYGKGPCALVLQADSQSRPIHAVWGIPKGRNGGSPSPQSPYKNAFERDHARA